MALTDNLISYWKLDEASGSRADSHGSNTLTDNNTVGSSTGKISTAGSFVAANSEYLSLTDNDDVSIATSSVSYEFSMWVNLSSTSGTQQTVTKRDGILVGSGLEYMLRMDSGTPTVYWGTTPSGFSSLAYGSSLSSSTWYFLTFGFDHSVSQFFVSLNAGTPTYSSTVTNQQLAGANNFHIGGTTSEYFDGLIDEVGFWKRVLTSGERTSLYNSGSGLAYPFSSGGLVVTPFRNRLMSPGHIFGGKCLC